jgi:molybdopterin molybdotransferase
VEFTKVAMQPGGPQGAGTVDGVPVVTLPGNPVSAFVSFEVFVRPAIRRMMSRTPESRPLRQATLTEGMRSPAEKTQFARGWYTPSGAYGLPEVRPVGGAGSHLLGDLALANCFIVVGEDVTDVKAGAQVDVLVLGRDEA